MTRGTDDRESGCAALVTRVHDWREGSAAIARHAHARNLLPRPEPCNSLGTAVVGVQREYSAC